MPSFEQKWQANKDKVAFAKAFPGMLLDAGNVGNRVERDVVLINQDEAFVATVYTDGCFLIEVSGRKPTPADILKALWLLRDRLPEHAAAYAKLDELAAADRELTRLARKENILGAIRNNIAMLPELYEEIPRLLDELRAGTAASCATEEEASDPYAEDNASSSTDTK